MAKEGLSLLRLIDIFFFFSSRRRHTRFDCDWSSDVCSSDLIDFAFAALWVSTRGNRRQRGGQNAHDARTQKPNRLAERHCGRTAGRCVYRDRKSTRLNSSHSQISYAVFCLKKKKTHKSTHET